MDYYVIVGVIELDIQEDIKAKCPFCGAEIEKHATRCENCGSIIDVKVEESISFETNEELYTIADQDSEAENPKPNPNPNINTNISSNPSSSTNPNPEGVEEAKLNDKPAIQSNTGNPFTQGPFYNQSTQNKKIMPPPTKALSNGMKVAVTAICCVIPALGQLVGIILSIVYMNASETESDYEDKRSFGLALLITSVAVLGFSCLICFALIFIGAASQGSIFQR